MRKFTVGLCAGFALLASLFSLLWFCSRLEDPLQVYLISQISPVTAMVVGGVALASMALALLVNRIQTGEEKAYSRFHNRNKTIPLPSP